MNIQKAREKIKRVIHYSKHNQLINLNARDALLYLDGSTPSASHNNSIRQLLCDLHGYLGSGVENRRSDYDYRDRINMALAQLPEC